MKGKPRQPHVPALDLIEEAVHLLRMAPAHVLATHFVGAAPFVIGFLYFWSDMSRSAFAAERCAPLAGVVALLFIWMKACQTAFARQLREQILGRPLPPMPASQWVGMVASQSFIHATGFLLLPLAFVLTVPAGWAFAFYQNATVLAAVPQDGRPASLKIVVRQTLLWPGQNHLILLVVFCCGLIVFINCVALMFVVPFLLKTLLGIETVLSQSWLAMANTTFIAAAAWMAWLIVDPLIKAVYALRCFHGLAIHNGDDLKVDFQRARANRRTALTLALLILGPVLHASAQDASSAIGDSSPAPSATVSELDQALDETLRGREYAWRMPRDEAREATPDNRFAAMLQNSLNWIGEQVKSLFRSVFQFIRWIFDKLFGSNTPSAPSGTGWINALRAVFILVIIALVAGLVYLVFRLWSDYRSRKQTRVAQAVPEVPDLEDDSITAAQLPENEWLRLAREMMEKGEFRLALRAYYLAGLAHLGERGLISIQRHKSNFDYLQELDRRAHALPVVLSVFGSMAAQFDRVWYGRHPATSSLVMQAEDQLKQLSNA